MKSIFKKTVKFFLGKTFGQKFFSLLYLVGLKGMNFGGGTDPKDSGEDYVVKYALSKLTAKTPVVFDVGGNYGEYTKLWQGNMKIKSRSGKFHIFEPSNSAFGRLKQVFNQNSQVILNNFALSDAEGEAVLYSDFNGSGLASLANRDLGHAGVIMQDHQKISVKTLDSYCWEKNISQIDFLKLDVEGFEFAVLKGGQKLLAGGHIKFIQFEFGGTDIDTRIFFKDFYKLLNEKYFVYRILKNGLKKIEKYSELEEIFLTTNYLAELKNNA